MIQAMVLMLAAASSFAATSPLEADFPDGYWDREIVMFAGRSGPAYNVSIAVSDPSFDVTSSIARM